MARSPSQLSGLSDAPISTHTEDTLEMRAYAQALAAFTRTCKTPMTISIQGDWGSGKSSIMQMVRSEIGSGKSGDAPKTIWFDTWQFAQFGSGDTLPLTLLSTFVRKLQEGKKGQDTRIKEVMGLLRRILIAPAGNIAVKMATGGLVSGSELAPGDSGETMLSSELFDKLRITLERLIEDEGRVVFFVDDLDRIPPVQAVTLLETIKIFLNVKNVVFILALDYEVVERGLKEKFHVTSYDLGGRSFFDKLIQLPFTIPVGSYRVERYLRSALDELGYLPRNKNGPEDDVSKLVALVDRSVGRNPRAIKRVLNSLHLLRLIRSQSEQEATEGSQAGIDALELDLAVLCLQSQFEPVYAWLSRSDGSLKSKLDRMGGRRADKEVDGDEDDTQREKDGYEVVVSRMLERAKGRELQEKARFERFADEFLSLVGVGGTENPEQAQELELRISYLNQVLNLTRVTSSGSQEVTDSEVQGLKIDPDVRRALRAQTRNKDPKSFWGRLSKLRGQISPDGRTEIGVRQPDTENSVRFNLPLSKIPGYLKVRIADSEVKIWLEFDGRSLRNEDSRKSLLARVNANTVLASKGLNELTSDGIEVYHESFEDTSLKAVKGREPELIKHVVEFYKSVDDGFHR